MTPSEQDCVRMELSVTLEAFRGQGSRGKKTYSALAK